MTASLMVRRSAAALLAGALCLAVLPGCGGSSPKDGKQDDKKETPKPDATPAPTPNPTPNPTPTPPSEPPKSVLDKIDDDADKFASTFLHDVMHKTAKADALTPVFLKTIGKPLFLPSEKAKGYSEDTAERWMNRVGEGINFGLATYQKQVGNVVYIRGTIGGMRLGKDPNKTGSYSLRLVKDGTNWKADWLSLCSVTPPEPIQLQIAGAATPDGIAQGFAVAAFLESITDHDGMPMEDRMLLVGAAMTPPLRTAWAQPFGDDTAQGLDYNRATLNREAVKVGGGTSAFVATRDGTKTEFRVEMTKPTGKKAYTVKLVNGSNPNEWLVSEVTEAK
jgi:hypothetical protein